MSFTSRFTASDTRCLEKCEILLSQNLTKFDVVARFRETISGFDQNYRFTIFQKIRIFLGFTLTQEYEIDYEETFVPMNRLSYARTLVVISAPRKWSLFQMDVKNVFLNGEF